MSTADNVFGGRYRIVGEVGRGGMGVIYRGVDSVLDREVAIKVMSSDFSETTEETRARFFREAKAAARLQHRNIVTVFEFAEQDGVPYIVMEFLKGQSLAARMSAEPPLTLEQKLDVMTELCNGLQFAHENGVVHRDVKPGNVWLLDDSAVKLVDFGIAKISSSMMTLHGDVMGSASYMSPEQIEGREVTGRSDVFSAAVMLYEILARRRPFEAESPTATMMRIVHQPPPPIESLVPDLPPALVAAIARGLEKNPDDRFQSAAEFGSELQLIRMSLPRDEATVIQPVTDPTVLATLSFKSEPLPRSAQAASAPVATGRTGGVSRAVLAGVGALVVIAGIAYWFSRTASAPVAAPPQQQAPSQGTSPVAARTIRIDSKPQGASIQINGQDTGKVTPADVEFVAAATLTLSKGSFEPREVGVSEADLKKDRLYFELTATAPVRVSVEISGDYPFEVWDGPRRLKESADTHLIQAAVGQRLTLKAPEHFLDQSFEVESPRAGRVKKSAPGLGEIALTGNESCMVFLDGRRLDYVRTPIPQIAAGEHTFKFECTDGSSPGAMPVRIVPGQNPTRFVGR